ncbi:hypothetical protein CCACVL1_22333 [Corchorus capsularis]|uniref:DUF7356 domain-containing protein n=1 Tax=Corchorus capsularis TaxID=210143 RepID=A0A1R3H0B1_COCAP|nr:hypothetical protein CCACVL1_22333 [Corchorus capsularis]
MNSGTPKSFPSPAPAPGPSSNQGCWLLSKKTCRNESLAACIDPSTIASEELLVLVKNDGEGLLEVNVSISHAEHIIQDKKINITGHQVEEVKLAAYHKGNSSILVDAGNLGCSIYIEPTASRGVFDYLALRSHIIPPNGIFLLFVTSLIFGTTWACYKLGKRVVQQGDGISYQQLEMGQGPDSPSVKEPDSPSVNNVEAAEGWERDWDGDWDELKSKAAKGSSVNGLTARTSKRDDQENNWDD